MVKKILVAEHNPAVMTMIVDYLKSHFKAIKVETARSSEELLKKSISAELLGKPYAFIFTDECFVLGMSPLDAVGIYRGFEQSYRRFGYGGDSAVPIYIHTNSDDGEFVSLCFERGIDGFITRGPKETFLGLDQILKSYFKPKTQK